jgi:hypothetical protein
MDADGTTAAQAVHALQTTGVLNAQLIANNPPTIMVETVGSQSGSTLSRAAAAMQRIIASIVAARALYALGARAAALLALDEHGSIEDVSKIVRSQGLDADFADGQAIHNSLIVHDTYIATDKKKIITDEQSIAKQQSVMRKLGITPLSCPPFLIPESIIPMIRFGVPEGDSAKTSGVLGGAAAAAAGAAVGTMLIPIPILGTLVGGLLGKFIGGKLGGKNKTPNKDFWSKVYKKGTWNLKFLESQIARPMARVEKAIAAGKKAPWDAVRAAVRWSKLAQVLTGKDYNANSQYLIENVGALRDKIDKTGTLDCLDEESLFITQDSPFYDIGRVLYCNDELGEGQRILACEGHAGAPIYIGDTKADIKTLKQQQQLAAAKRKAELLEAKAAAKQALLLSKLSAQQAKQLAQVQLQQEKQAGKVALQQAKQTAQLAKIQSKAGLVPTTQSLITGSPGYSGSPAVGAEVPQGEIFGSTMFPENYNYSNSGYNAPEQFTAQALGSNMLTMDPNTMSRPGEGRFTMGEIDTPFDPNRYQISYGGPEDWGYGEASEYGGEIEIAFDIAYDACLCDACSTGSFFDNKDNCTGSIYRSSLLDVRATRLPSGVYGRTFLNTMPFRVEIASNATPARQRIALQHELTHVMDQTLKLGLSHDQVHASGLMLASELVPAMEQLKQKQPNE